MNIELTSDQALAKDKIVEWFEKNDKSKQLFILSGYAGSGKTFLIDYLINDVLEVTKDRVAFCTPTGKASSVLISKGQESTTIHHLIYTPTMNEEYVEEDGIDEEGNQIVVKKKKKVLKFRRRDSIDDYDLIILDEVSMVDDEMLKDLMSYNIPILATGDIGQLPPVQRSNTYIENPDAMLREVVRQSADNKIVQIATMARNKEYIPYGDYGDVVVVKNSELDDETYKSILMNADQIICGTNNLRHSLNDQLREFHGININTQKTPIAGEKIILTENNWGLKLYDDYDHNYVNGLDGIVVMNEDLDNDKRISRMSIKTQFEEETTNKFYYDSGIFLDKEFISDTGSYITRYFHESKSEVYKKDDGKYNIVKPIPEKGKYESTENFRKRVTKAIKERNKIVELDSINRLEFGYAISCHKSQGSEYDNVVVFDESGKFRKDKYKWLYTAITRAKKKLVIIRPE